MPTFMDQVKKLRLEMDRMKGQYGDDYTNSAPVPVGRLIELNDLIQQALLSGVELMLSVFAEGKPYPPDHVDAVFDVDHIDLTFEAARGTVDAQRVYRSVDGGDFAAIVPDVGATDTGYEDADVSSDHSYSYYVVGVNENGESLPSMIVVEDYHAE